MQNDLLQTVRKYCKTLLDVDLEVKNLANIDYDCVFGGGNFKNLILSGFRPVERFKKLFNPAFTLAEVLITIGIIGIVAAMTIPSLMTKVKEKQTVTKVKKAYSNLSNAMRILEHDGDIDWSYCATKTSWDTYNDNCLKKLAYVLKGSILEWNDLLYYGCGGIDEFFPNTGIQGLDGMTYLFSCYNPSDMGILVDVNGKKGPNEIGEDIFGFYYDNYKPSATTNTLDKSLTVSLRPMDTSPNLSVYPPTRKVLSCDRDNVGLQCTAWVINKGNMNYLPKTSKVKSSLDSSGSSFVCNNLDNSGASFICNMTSSNSFICNSFNCNNYDCNYVCNY